MTMLQGQEQDAGQEFGKRGKFLQKPDSRAFQVLKARATELDAMWLKGLKVGAASGEKGHNFWGGVRKRRKSKAGQAHCCRYRSWDAPFWVEAEDESRVRLSLAR